MNKVTNVLKALNLNMNKTFKRQTHAKINRINEIASNKELNTIIVEFKNEAVKQKVPREARSLQDIEHKDVYINLEKT
jgi:hypothetical protein